MSTLADAVDRHAATRGSAIALVDAARGDRISYAALGDLLLPTAGAVFPPQPTAAASAKHPAIARSFVMRRHVSKPRTNDYSRRYLS